MTTASLQKQGQMVDIFESIRDRMTGSEIDLVEVRFKEFDHLVEGKSDERYQLEVLGEIETVLTAIQNDK